jgi:hypothetical protein
LKNKGKHTLPRNCSGKDEQAHGDFDPMVLMATVAQQEAEVSTGEALLRAGQTVYAPSDVNAGKLKRTCPDGVIEEGTFSGDKFIPDG